MYVSKVSLKNYRNLKTNTIELKNGVNIFYGNNAQGKTNFLESIYMCATGRSHRTNFDNELIKFNQLETHIQLFCQKDTIFDRIDIHLKKDTKKGIAINSIPIKKIGDLFGVLNVVIFSPEDLNLVKSGPSERRRFIDMEICQISKVYYHNLQQYHKILKQRNNLLKSIDKDNSLKDTIFIWDSQLIDFGKKVILSRNEFVDKLNKVSNSIHSSITNNKEKLKIIYKENVKIEDFESKLQKSLSKDIITKTTNYGPHKDDLIIFVNDINLRNYGSQGQQRTASLSLKLAEIDIIKSETNDLPILLLDDVLSELDKSRQELLINSIGNLQTIITCTGVEDIIKGCDNFIYRVDNGEIIW